MFAVENKTLKSNKLQIKSDLVLGRYYEIDTMCGIKDKSVKVHFYIYANIHKRDGLVILFLLYFLRRPSYNKIHHLKSTIQCFNSRVTVLYNYHYYLISITTKRNPQTFSSPSQFCSPPTANLLSVSMDLSVLNSSSK